MSAHISQQYYLIHTRDTNILPNSFTNVSSTIYRWTTKQLVQQHIRFDVASMLYFQFGRTFMKMLWSFQQFTLWWTMNSVYICFLHWIQSYIEADFNGKCRSMSISPLLVAWGVCQQPNPHSILKTFVTPPENSSIVSALWQLFAESRAGVTQTWIFMINPGT